MLSIVDEMQECDNLANKIAKDLIDTVNFYCSVYQALKESQPKELSEEEKLKIKQREILQKMANNSYFDNLHYKKELKKNGIVFGNRKCSRNSSGGFMGRRANKII